MLKEKSFCLTTEFCVLLISCVSYLGVLFLKGLDGEATEPMIKELEEEREELQDPEVEFAIAGAVKECGGLEVILSMIQASSVHFCSEILVLNIASLTF